MIKKILLTSLGLVFLATPLVASAQTVSDLQSELATLEQQLAQLAAQLGAVTTTTSTSNTSTTATPPPDNESATTNTSASQCPALTSELSQVAGENTDASTGGQITQLQEFLALYFNLSPNIIVTGFFGPTTASYVTQFQAENNLPQVGYVGSQTRAAIASVCAAENNPTGTPTFTASPSGGQMPLTVSFTASGTGVGASTIIDFDDSSTSTLTASGSTWTASHTYGSVGTYTARIENPTTSGGIATLQVIGSASVIVSATTTSDIAMTVPGSVQLASGQTAFTSNGTSPVFTLNTIDTNGTAATDAQITVGTSNATLTLNAPQIIGTEQFTLTSLTSTSATIAVAQASGLTFNVPGTVSFTAVGQTATDHTDGYAMQLTSVNPSTLLAGVAWTPSQGASNDLTLALGTPQNTTGGITLLLSALSNGGATINITGGSVNPDYAVSSTPASGASPLSVSLSYSPSLQTFVSAYCEEAQGTSQYNIVVDWGDGAGPQNNPSTVCNSHTYNAAGTFTVHVSVYPAGSMTALWTGSTQVTVTPGALVSCLSLNPNLTFGPGATDATTGGEVTELQKFLAQDPLIYPQGLVTGYYGPATTAAVQNYQVSQDIVNSGTPDTTGFGFVGPHTLQALVKNCPTFNAQFSATPTSGPVLLAVTFNATGTPGTYTLTPGDGGSPLTLNIPIIECPSASCTGTTSASYIYAKTGTYTATLTRMTCDGNDPSTCANPTAATVGTATITVNATSTSGGGGTTASCTAALPTQDMSLGDTDADVGGDVTLLQDFLIAQGDLPTGDNTGFFGNATQAAVMEFQQANNVSPVSGFVGPLTRAAMEALCTGQKPSSAAFSFTAAPASGPAPLSTTFTASNAETLDTGFSYVVDFGDGTRASMVASSTTQFSVSHTYSASGTFQALLLQERNLCNGVSSFSGCVSDLQVASTSVTVSGPTSALSVSCTPSSPSTTAGSSVTWSATASGGTGGYTYSWSDTVGNKQSTSTAASWAQTYPSAGSVTATVNVADSSGATATASCMSTVAATQQTFSVGADCNGAFCAADQATANELCVTKGFASASSMQSYPITQSNPNDQSAPTGNESWWNNIAWQFWWGGQCNAGGVCTPENPNELSQVTCTGTAPVSLVGTADLPAQTNLSASCTGDTAMFSWTPQGQVNEWQLTLSVPGGGWYCQPSSNQMCSTMLYNTVNPTFSTQIPEGLSFEWSLAPEQSNGATGPSVAGPQVMCDIPQQPQDSGGS